MNNNNLKKYAPQVRRDFMAAVSQSLNQFGIHTDSKGQLAISEAVISGSMMQIDGSSFDAKYLLARKRLVSQTEQKGFDQLVEQVAYTWFNRLCAIRFMELKADYLEHGLRVLSHPSKGQGFEILDYAQDVAELLGLDRSHIVELKLAGNQDEALYRYLLLGQCHQLHQAMPFLFEALDDETELLLPYNLTRTDSILRGLVDSIPEDDWQQVEIIGWLYQFYISEKKDQVIGNVVKSEDIPAATQLFTPNWIVKYLVQNSVGRQWLMTYPDSGLKARMEYYIEPAEQEPSVIEALAAITPTSIDPETIKVLDPACGSGHILVEAYDILKAIYEERGYRIRDIPKLILEKNLYGLDIDDRAVQLAGFALMMKAREDDRRIFTRDIKLNVLAIQSTQNLDLPDLWRKLALNQDAKRGSTESIFDDVQINLVDTVDDIEFEQLRAILALFEQAKTLGSLIQVPKEQAEYLRNLTGQLQGLIEQGDSMQIRAATDLLPYVQQSWLLVQQYDAVVANPPYMGFGYHNASLKEFAKTIYADTKSDIYSMFMSRCMLFGKRSAIISLMTPFTWLSIKSFNGIRKEICENKDIISLVQPEYHAFFESAYVPICAFVLRNLQTNSTGVFVDLSPYYGADIQAEKLMEAILDRNHPQRFEKNTRAFNKVPGKAILFGLSYEALQLLSNSETIGDLANISEGIKTGDNQKFLRFWHEVSLDKATLIDENVKKWRPHHKGGEYRRWFGNLEHVINWANDGEEIKASSGSGLQGKSYYFSQGITWSKLSSSYFGVRLLPRGVLFDSGSPAVFPHDTKLIYPILAFLSSNSASYLIKKLNPTLNFQVGNVASLPFPLERISSHDNLLTETAKACTELSEKNWNSMETSWNFKVSPIISLINEGDLLESSFMNFSNDRLLDINNIQQLEIKNNETFVHILGLEAELSSDISENQITLTRADQEKDIQRLISYAIGCIMGRYSLDEPGLIYAHAGNVGFDATRYQTLPADEDGILPLTDQPWFKDDATNRFREFLVAVWGEDSLQRNLEFVAEILTLSSFKAKKGETSLDTVRRYLSNQFYKDHLQTYKKRPIYWLFSSGKQKAFECLVYLHRYNDSTLARMRTEYVTPLQSKYSAYVDQLNQQLQDASSSEATRIKKDIQALEKKQTELRQFDDKLKHYADMRIKIDLDDGVKVNYGKFGDLLAEVKAITGGTGD